MTTIAYRDGIMAADSLATGGDVRRGEVAKLDTLADGTILGLTGSSGLAPLVCAWLAAGAKWEDRPKLPDGLTIGGLLVRPGGTVFVISTNFVLQQVTAEFHAQGSGNEIAIGAMAMGATAEQDVAVAAKFDIYTGGAITTLCVRAYEAARITERNPS